MEVKELVKRVALASFVGLEKNRGVIEVLSTLVVFSTASAAFAQIGGVGGSGLGGILDLFSQYVKEIAIGLVGILLIVVAGFLAPVALPEIFAAWKSGGITGVIITISVFVFIAGLGLVIYVIYKKITGNSGGVGTMPGGGV